MKTDLIPPPLNFSPHLDAAARGFDGYSELVKLEENEELNKDITVDVIGESFLQMANSILDITCANGGDLSVLIPFFSKALAYSVHKPEVNLSICYQSAILLFYSGQPDESRTFLSFAIKLNKHLIKTSNNNQITCLAHALDTFWPEKAGGQLRITAAECFDHYANHLVQNDGPEAELQFWKFSMEQLPLDLYPIRPLYAHVRMRLGEIALKKQQLSLAKKYFDESLVCYEQSCQTDYSAFIKLIEEMLEQYVPGLPHRETFLTKMSYYSIPSEAECDKYIQILTGKESFNKKRYAALFLSHVADLYLRRSDDKEELKRAMNYLIASSDFLSLLSLEKGADNNFKITLMAIDLGLEHTAILAFSKAVYMQQQLGAKGNRVMLAAQKNVRRYHPFSKVESEALIVYRFWSDKCFANYNNAMPNAENDYIELLESLNHLQVRFSGHNFKALSI